MDFENFAKRRLFRAMYSYKQNISVTRYWRERILKFLSFFLFHSIERKRKSFVDGNVTGDLWRLLRIRSAAGLPDRPGSYVRGTGTGTGGRDSFPSAVQAPTRMGSPRGGNGREILLPSGTNSRGFINAERNGVLKQQWKTSKRNKILTRERERAFHANIAVE